MLKGLAAFTRLELLSLFGVNKIRHTENTKEKRKLIALACAYILVAAVLIAYICVYTYGLCVLSLSSAVPQFLAALCTFMILLLGILKNADVVFKKRNCDFPEALPVTKTVLVLSRFLRLYLENLAFSLLICVPALSVYIFFVHPTLLFYVFLPLSLLALPLLPTILSVFLGTLVQYVSSFFPKKSILQAILACALVIGILLFSGSFSSIENEITEEMLKNAALLVKTQLSRLCPPADLFSDALTEGSFASFLAFVLLNGAVFLLGVYVTSRLYRPIMEKLLRTAARKGYKRSDVRETGVLPALIKKEFRRYFASGIYVTNTIIGPVLTVAAAASLLFFDLESALTVLPININLPVLAPYALSGMMLLMCPAGVSVSMEGKMLWISKTLPLKAKTVLSAKILMTVILIAPFALISSVLLIIALEQTLLTAVFTLAAPVCMLLSVSAYAVFINLRLPVFDWENEVYVVKQSASAAAVGFGGTLLCLLSALPLLFAPEALLPVFIVGIPVVHLLLAYLLFGSISKTDLASL